MCLIHTVIHNPLDLAVEDELIATNPATGMGKYNRRRPESEEPMPPFSERELDHFLDTVQIHGKTTILFSSRWREQVCGWVKR